MTDPRNGARRNASPSPQAKPSQRNDQYGRDFSAWFGHVASAIATFAGSPWMFLFAVSVVAIWGILGPIYHYSDTWQLVINTGTTIVTFLVVFLIQNTQNRDAKAIHLKLDEIIRSISHAHNEMIDIEKLSDRELAELSAHYERIRSECERRDLRKENKPAG